MPQEQPGFLGSTSYAAVFTENSSQIGLDADHEVDGVQLDHSSSPSPEHEKRVKEGAALLGLLSEFHRFEPFVEQWLDYARGLALIAPYMPACMASIKRDLYDPFVRARSGKALLAASEMLFKNSARPLKLEPHMSFMDYPTLFTGPNLRWEAVGMLFTAVGLSCSMMIASEAALEYAFKSAQIDKRALAHRMLEASDASIAFCEQTGQLNDPVMWLIYENFLLMTLVIGDSSTCFLLRFEIWLMPIQIFAHGEG